MKFLRTLDLYKVIVLLSVVLLPLGWWWVRSIDESIRLCRATIEEAKKPNGLIEQIGSLQKKVEIVVQNRLSTSDAIKAPGTYFAGQILVAGGQNLKADDFGLPSDPKEESASMGPTRQKASDFVADVVWKRKELTVEMKFIHAVLFNCESGVRTGGEAGQQSVWKLRKLTLVNATDDRLVNTKRTPPPELLDKWSIVDMKFARREPRKGA